MKSITKLLPVLVILTSTICFCNAQVQSGSVRKGRIFTTDGKKILFRNLTIGDVSHRYQSSSSNKYQEIAGDNTVRIERQTGSEAGKWALICGLSGLVGSTLGVLEAKNSTDSWEGAVEVKIAPIIIGLTSVSAILGAVIGATKKKYKTVYSNPKYKTGNNNQRLNVDIAFHRHWKGASIRYQF